MNPEPILEAQGARRTHSSITRQPTWKKVTTGNCKDPNDFIARLSALRVELTASARKLVDHVCDGLMGEREVSLVVKTISELGFKRAAELREVVEACARQGLTYCPKDTALAMSSEYSDLPLGEKVIVLSIPIEIDRLPCFFVVKRTNLSIELNGISLAKSDALLPGEKLVLAKTPERSLVD
jgi:hypothetical protein